MNKVSLNTRALGKARDEFALIFYRWAQADAKRQAAQQFPLFAFLRDPLAANYVKTYQTLTGNEKVRFLDGMVKRTHQRAVEISGEFITNEEQEVVEYFIRAPLRYDEKELESRRSRPRLGTKDRNQLGRLVKEHIKREVGGDFEEWTPTDFVFHKDLLPWRVSTIVSIKSKQNLGYDHTITVEGEPNYVKEHTSITRWLGIGETNWTLMMPEEIDQCAKAPLVLANYFLEAVPTLLGKITI